jgi:resuscitation-promoting factor RpfB
VVAEHACVPKLRLTLSSTISSSPKSGKLAAVIAGSALAVAALIAVVAAPSALAGSSPPSAQVRVATALAPARSASPNQQAPQQIARKMLRSFGWTWRQFRYLDLLWEAESSWNASAENPSTGAYGIPQAVPGSKMSAAGPDWQTDVTTQIRWGLGYISAAYGSPRSAWEHEVAYGWY